MYHVDIINNGSSGFKVRAGEYEFLADTKGAGVTPPDALLASLGACIGVYCRKYAESARLKLSEFNITVDADFSDDPPARFKEIRAAIDLKKNQLNILQKKELLEFIKKCPVHNTLKNNPDIILEMK